MIEYSLNLCYGIIITHDEMQKILEVLTNDEDYDDMIETYSRCVNGWIGERYFVGITINNLYNGDGDFVKPISDFSISVNDEDLIDFKRFFDEHDLWRFIDWKPQLMLINFCY